MEDIIMSKVVEFLKENPVQYLATVGRDGKSKMPSVYVYWRNGRKTVDFVPTTQKMFIRYAGKSGN